jgi:hypothetical protein
MRNRRNYRNTCFMYNHFIDEDEGTERTVRCKNPVTHVLLVWCYHPNSNRITKRYWRFCDECYARFIERNGEGFQTIYNKDPNHFRDAPVVGWDYVPAEMLIELIS